MAVTNGYATLDEAKERIQDAYRRVGTGIAFVSATSKITDTSKGLKKFVTDDIIQVSGSTANDGLYTIATGSVAGEIVTTEALVDEAAGDSVTIQAVFGIGNAAVNPQQDAMIEDIIEAASRWIDMTTGLTFFGNTETRSFFVGEHTDGRTLRLDKWLLSVTTLTNGDGNTIASTKYTFRPANDPPYYKIILMGNSGVFWQFTDDPEEDAITVAGSWGYSSSAPADIREACLLITARLWKRRDAVFGVAGSTAVGGQIIQGIPTDPDVMRLLKPYRMPMGF